MTVMLEREIKLRFPDRDTARAAVLRAGAMPLKGRRLQENFLLDTVDQGLGRRQSALRVRVESGTSVLTFKGPVRPGAFKVREELETGVADSSVLQGILEELGFHIWFRYQKYREEFAAPDLIVAVDETPVGTFVELEGEERAIVDMAAALGYGPGDYLLDSYRSLFVRHCEQHGLPVSDMLFDAEQS